MKVSERLVRMHPLNLRTTPAMRKKLEDAASANGRSLTSEIEHRLERSFDREAILDDLRYVLSEQRQSRQPEQPVDGSWKPQTSVRFA